MLTLQTRFCHKLVSMQRDWAILHHDTDHAVVLKPAGWPYMAEGNTRSALKSTETALFASSLGKRFIVWIMGRVGPSCLREHQQRKKRFRPNGPNSPKPTMPGMRANGKPQPESRPSLLKESPVKPPSNALAQGLGECMVRLPSWSGPFKRVAPIKSEDTLRHLATPSWGIPCTAWRPFTRDTDFI